MGKRLDSLGAPSFEDRRRTKPTARETLDLHGPGLFGFLIGALGNRELARVVYADVSQRVASEIERFEGRCSLRAWIYGLGRRELRDRRLRRQRPPENPAGSDAEPQDLEEAVAAIRTTLSEEDREFLILRVDRGFSWKEIAFTTLGEQAPSAVLDQEVVLLRGRVTAICEQIGRIAASSRSYRKR
jgi:DNA-directed RNA polymerase specialized sigma24 family protein